MTYQNLGYWIGQANDLSTGTHPGGWTNGQRWSETAGEWQAMYNDMVGQRDTWIANYNAAIASRDYWQHTVAHNDPNVWDNRYNAGYSAGAGSKTTTYQTTTAWQGITTDGNNSEHWSTDRIGIVSNRTGLSHVSIWVGVGTDGSAVSRRLRILKNGVAVVEGPDFYSSSGGTAMAHAIFNTNNGDGVSVQCLLNGSKAHYNGSCEMFMETGNQ